MTGRYRLTLIATGGPRAGQVVEGGLALRAPEGGPLSMPGVMNAAMVLIGTTDIAPERVGAKNMGGLDSTDPMRPGVAVIEQVAPLGGGPTIVMRIGAEGNRRDARPFEGSYFALFVRQLRATDFAGGWASGATSEEAAGRFCAVRVSE